MKMIEDNEDVIIPDDMKQFLIQQKQSVENQNPDNTTPRVNNSVDEWVQQTTSINHINGYNDTQYVFQDKYQLSSLVVWPVCPCQFILINVLEFHSCLRL